MVLRVFALMAAAMVVLQYQNDPNIFRSVQHFQYYESVQHTALYDFITNVHAVNKWMTFVTFVATDHKQIGIGKTYKAVLEPTTILLVIVQHIPAKYIALETTANNFFLKLRIEICFTTGDEVCALCRSAIAQKLDNRQECLKKCTIKENHALKPTANANMVNCGNKTDGYSQSAAFSNIYVRNNSIKPQAFDMDVRGSGLSIKLHIQQESILFQDGFEVMVWNHFNHRQLNQQTLAYLCKQKYIHQTLPLYQRSVSLIFGNESWPADEDFGKDDRWLPIGDPQKRFKIYSAYFDPRLEVVESYAVPDGFLPLGSVRIFAILPINVRKSVIFCNFRSDNIYVAQHRSDEVEAIHEHWNMDYSATYVICKLAGNITKPEARLPDEVALSYLDEPSMREASNFVRIKYPQNDRLFRSAPKRSLAVCIGPLQHNYAQALRMVEFFEYYLLNGAERFYVYNKSATPEVNAVLNNYKAEGIVHVLDWHFEGYKYENELRYEGIFVALNDCFYRATVHGDFQYTAIVDFDELLFPARDNQTLLQFLQAKDRYDVNSFNFQSVFLYDLYDPDFSQVPPGIHNTYLYTQVRNVRTKNPLLHHNRSKYVLKGRNILEAGNHFVWKAVRDTHEYAVPENEGLLMHYRDGSLGYDFENVVVDDRIRERFGNRLWWIVNLKCSLVYPESSLCPLGVDYNRTMPVE